MVGPQAVLAAYVVVHEPCVFAVATYHGADYVPWLAGHWPPHSDISDRIAASFFSVLDIARHLIRCVDRGQLRIASRDANHRYQRLASMPGPPPSVVSSEYHTDSADSNDAWRNVSLTSPVLASVALSCSNGRDPGIS